MNNGEQGIFPSVYATDLEFFESESEVSIRQPESKVFQLHFLGTMEVASHKGTDILVDAIEKVKTELQNVRYVPDFMVQLPF